MAYTKTPDISTYSTVEIDLVKVNQSRSTSTSKDPNLINCYPEYTFNKLTKEQEVTVVKRSGYTTLITVAGTAPRGLFYWSDVDELYYSVDRNIHVYNASTGVLIVTLTNVFSNDPGNVGFTTFLYDNGTSKVVATNGLTIVTIDSAHTVVTGADADQPGVGAGSLLPIPIFLNGYLIVIKVGTADIYNSDLNDPLVFTAGNFINAEIEPDQLKSIVKLNNYIAVLGTNSIEYFYDAGIGTGSPLQRNESPVKQIGYIGGLARHNNTAFFVGVNRGSKPAVYVLEDLKVREISHAGIRRFLEYFAFPGETLLFGNVIASNGHDFYVLHNDVQTYALEIESEIWTQWVKKASTYFPIRYGISFVSLYGGKTYFTDGFVTNVYEMSPTYTQDDGTSFTMTIVTANEDFGTLNWKNMHRLVVYADYPTATQNLTIQWSDDDYQSYNTSQNLDLYQDLPCIYQLGGFRQRAFKLTYTDSLALRIEKLECEINKGTS